MAPNFFSPFFRLFIVQSTIVPLFQLKGPAAKLPITKKHIMSASCFHPFFYLFSSFFALSYFKLEEWTLDFFPRCNFAAKSLKAHVNTRIDTVDGKCLPIRVFSVFFLLFLFIRKERARTETIIGFEFIATSSSHILRTPYSCTRAR